MTAAGVGGGSEEGDWTPLRVGAESSASKVAQ